MSERTYRGLVRREVNSHLDVDHMVYIAPLPNGEDLVRPRGCDEPMRVKSFGDRTFAPGSIVTVGQRLGSSQRSIIAPPPPGMTGASRFPVVELGGSLDSISVVSAVPDSLFAGDSGVAVAVYGGPFKASPLDTFAAVIPGNGAPSGWPADPLVTISGVSWVSETEVTLTMSVSSAAPETHRISVRATR